MNKNLWICLSAIIIALTTFSPALSGPLNSLGKIPSKPEPELPQFLPDKPDQGFTLPDLREPELRLPTAPILVLKEVIFEGNTIFSDQELAQVAAQFLNQPVSLADLEELRHLLTQFYVDQGYVNSGAVITPDQEVADGSLIYQIVEGRLNEIYVTGNGRLKETYIQKRIWPKPDRSFNILTLQERFQLLLQDPLIKQMNGRILPGETPGQASLELEVTRKKPYELSLVFDNHSPPSLGSERILADGVLRNLTGYGDSLHLLLGHTKGDDEIDTRFSIPLNHYNTLFTAGYSRSSNEVVEAPLESIDVESRLKRVWMELNHPVYQTLSTRFDLGFTLDSQESKTFLLDTPFSFSKGYEAGKARVNAVRLIQAFQYRSSYHAFVLRSSLNLGVNLFDSTIHSDDLPDSEFISWLGQLQYAVRLGDRFGQVIFRGMTQLANDNLLSMEQFTVGGAATVRGYRENQVVRDNGYVLSLEWRVPVWEDKVAGQEKDRQILAAPFVDLGRGWNKGEYPASKTLSSAGIGLLWHGPWVDAQVYYAHGLDDVPPRAEHNLQDDGIHFKVAVKIF